MTHFEVHFNDGEYPTSIDVFARMVTAWFEGGQLVIQADDVTFKVVGDPDWDVDVIVTDVK